MSNPARAIGSVDALLHDQAFAGLIAAHGPELVKQMLRAVLTALRQAAAAEPVDTAPTAIAQSVERAIAALMAPGLRPVFNLTGTVLHTNLGRAPLPDVAITEMVAAAGAVNLEYDLESGQRGQRDSHVEPWLVRLTGAEAATAVNNNAAAVMLALNSLARGREVIVSRGELIEIGGAFRLPDIMERAGVVLREVGTTNRTHLHDYEAAIGAQTAMILQVHTSNYQVQGFTAAVGTADLARLARARGLALMVDLGSGTLIDLRPYGLPPEPTVREVLNKGADLVSFSGDKLLGGPQAGLLTGRAGLIAQITKNPMKRAMRLDKITIAALAAVLRLYADPDRLQQHLPTLRMLTRGPDAIAAQAARLLGPVQAALQGRATATIAAGKSQIGSGAMPVDLLETSVLVLTPLAPADAALRALALDLRRLPRPVIGRIHNGAVLLDLRTLDDETGFIAQLSILGAGNRPETSKP